MFVQFVVNRKHFIRVLKQTFFTKKGLIALPGENLLVSCLASLMHELCLCPRDLSTFWCVPTPRYEVFFAMRALECSLHWPFALISWSGSSYLTLAWLPLVASNLHYPLRWGITKHLMICKENILQLVQPRAPHDQIAGCGHIHKWVSCKAWWRRSRGLRPWRLSNWRHTLLVQHWKAQLRTQGCLCFVGCS